MRPFLTYAVFTLVSIPVQANAAFTLATTAHPTTLTAGTSSSILLSVCADGTNGNPLVTGDTLTWSYNATNAVTFSSPSVVVNSAGLSGSFAATQPSTNLVTLT